MLCFKSSKQYHGISRKGIFPNKLCIKFIKGRYPGKRMDIGNKNDGHFWLYLWSQSTYTEECIKITIPGICDYVLRKASRK